MEQYLTIALSITGLVLIYASMLIVVFCAIVLCFRMLRALFIISKEYIYGNH